MDGASSLGSHVTIGIDFHVIHVCVIEFAEHGIQHVEVAIAFFLVLGIDFLSDGLADLLFHESVHFLFVGLFGRVVSFALPTFGIRLVAKGLSFGLVVSLLETGFVLVAFDCGVVGPPMAVAPFLFLGIRGFGTLVVSILGVVGFTSHGRAGRVAVLNCFTVFHDSK